MLAVLLGSIPQMFTTAEWAGQTSDLLSDARGSAAEVQGASQRM